MTYILIYIAGFIVSYYGWKLLEATRGWESVGFRLFISIFSWVSVVIGIALLVVFLIQDFFQNNKIFKKDPPKWL
jgi:TRAP-type C4-dicarboxylate transport system permease small subunit